MPVIPTPNPDIPTTVTTSTTAQTSSTPTPEKPSPTVTAPSATSKPSPRQHQINTEPLAVSPLSAYQDPSLEESEEKESEGGDEKLEEMPIAVSIPEGGEREEIDLNETTSKQGLMTDEEFQSLMDGVNRMEEETAKMAEGLDLVSEAVVGGEASGIAGLSEDVVHQSVAGVDERQTEEEVPESMTPQPGVREGDEQTEERDAEVPAEEPESMTSSQERGRVMN